MTSYLRGKLREGMARIAREHPEVDFSVNTPEIRAAWAAVNAMCVRWYRFQVSLRAIQETFAIWEAALIAASGAVIKT